MRSYVLVFSLLLSGAFLQSEAQSVKKIFSKAGKQGHLTRNTVSLAGFTGKNGMLPDSIEQYSYDPFKKEYSQFPNSTEHFTYDQDGKVLESITHQPPYNSSRYTYVYSNGKQIEDIRYEWNAATSSWYPTNRDQVFSNQFGVDTMVVSSLYDTTSQTWIEEYREVYSIEYDINNRPLFTTYKDYDALSQTWTFYGKVQFNYSGADTLPSELYVYEWDGANWEQVLWAPRVKWELGFSPNLDFFEPTLVLGYEWDGVNWTESIYDSSVVVDGNIEDYYSFEFDMDSQYFVMAYSYHSAYDSYGNEISSINMEWEFGLSDTSYVELNEIIYGSNGEVREWVNRYWSTSSGTEYRTKDIYYYGPNALVSAEKLDVIIYPNPVSSAQKLFIQSETTIEQVNLYSYAGTVVGNWNGIDPQGLDIQGLEPGLYFVHLMDVDGNAVTQRLQIR